jgi:hypothetical protein
VDALLDSAWADTPPYLPPFATLSREADLEKLADEGRLPPDLA